MAGSTFVSPKASVFGDTQNQGIVVAQCTEVNAPGGFVFSVNSAGTILYLFMWVDTSGVLRIIQAVSGTVIYDPGTNQITFDDFDQDADGTVVGSQS